VYDALNHRRGITVFHEDTKGPKLTKSFDQKDFVFFGPSILRDKP